MQKLKLLLPLALFIGAFFMACQEDDPFGNGPMADVTFAGRIIDESGEAVKGALVKAGDEAAVTDANGVFRLESLRLPAMHAMVTVSKAGYFDVSRPYIVEDDALQTITIQLLEKKQAGLISAGAGGLVNVPGGPSLNFPANAVTDANGNAYSGTALVFARYLDPSDPNLGLFLPGDMTAENAADEEVFLATYGMLGVEIEGPNGQKLKIASGKEVELRMPILASQLASAPSSIPLWHYDLEDGHWKEEGSAQKVGNEYVGKVSHFSFWNCDAPFPLTQLHGKIYLENANQPLANACVRITMLSTGAYSFGYTDGNGHFGGCIPKDEALKLEVILPESCGGQVYHTENVGPFSGVSTLPNIIIPASAQLPLIRISGRLVGCSGQSIPNGYLKFEVVNEFKNFLFADANGSFNYVGVLCNSNTQAGILTGYDLTNLLESLPLTVSIPPNTANVGDITICTALTEYIRYTLDGGQEIVKLDPLGGMNAFGTTISTGDSTQQTIILSFNNNGQLGVFPISAISVNQVGSNNASGTLTTNLTSFGNVGDPMVGTIGGTFQDNGGASHTLSGSYRVIRDW